MKRSVEPHVIGRVIAEMGDMIDALMFVFRFPRGNYREGSTCRQQGKETGSQTKMASTFTTSIYLERG
jgi:hypothetical protein